MKNKIYMAVANMYKEIKDAMGKNKSLKDAIVYEVDKAKEVVGARGNFDKLNSRLNFMDNSIELNSIDKGNIDSQIEDIKNLIPERNIGLIEDKYRSIAFSKGEVTSLSTNEVFIKSGKEVILPLPKNSTVVNSKVRSFGRFIPISNTANASSASHKITDSNTAYDDSICEIGNNGIEFIKQLTPEFIIEEGNDSIVINNILDITTSNGVSKDIFISKGMVFNTSTFDVKIIARVPVFCKRIGMNVVGDNFVADIVVTYEDNTTLEKRVVGYDGSVDLDVSKKVKSFIASFQNKELTPITVKYLGVTCDSVKTKSGKIEFSDKIVTSEVDKYISPVGSFGEGIRAKVAIKKDNGLLSYISEEETIRASDFRYSDMLMCPYKTIRPNISRAYSLSKSFDIVPIDGIYSEIIFGNGVELNGHMFDKASFKFSNVVYELNVNFKGEWRNLKLSSLGKFEFILNDGSIMGTVLVCSKKGVAILFEDVTGISEVELIVYSPIENEPNPESWISTGKVSKVTETVKIAEEYCKKHIINGEHSMIKHAIDSVSARLSESEYNCKYSTSIFSYSENLSEESIQTTEHKGFGVSKYKLRNPGTKFIIFVAEDNGIDQSADTMITNTIKGKDVKHSDRMELVAEKFIGNLTTLLSIQVQSSEGARFKFSTNGIEWFGFNDSIGTWVRDFEMNSAQVNRLNDTILQNFRMYSDRLYVKVKFLSMEDSVSDFKLIFNDSSFIDISEHEIHDKGFYLQDLNKIDMRNLRNGTYLSFMFNVELCSTYMYFNLKSFDYKKVIGDKFIDISSTDINIEYIGSSHVKYKNNESEDVYVSVISSSNSNSLALDLNKQGYQKNIAEIKEENKILKVGIKNLMDSVSDIMTTLAGEGGADYIKDFMINSYKKVDCGMIQAKNIFKISDVKSIMGVSVWEKIAGDVEYIKQVSYSNHEIDKFEHVGISFSNDRVELETENSTTPVIHYFKNYKGTSIGSNVSDFTKLYNNTSSWQYGSDYSYHTNSGAIISFLSKDRPFISYTFDLGKQMYIHSMPGLQYGYAQVKTNVAYSLRQRTTISISNNGLDYFNVYTDTFGNYHTSPGEFYPHSGYNPVATANIGRTGRYIKVLIEPVNSSELENGRTVKVAIRRAELRLGEIHVTPHGNLYNKVPINTADWKGIKYIKVNYSSAGSDTVKIRFSTSIGESKSWIYLNGTAWANASSYGTTLDIHNANAEILNKLIETGKLTIDVQLNGNGISTTPIVYGVDVCYITSDGTERIVTANNYDYKLEFVESTNELIVHNTSEKDKHFELMLS